MKHFSFLIIFVFLTALIATAQNPTATLVGTVQDGSNAVIPGATVVARNNANNLRWTGVSGNAGEFTIPNLQPGQYTVTVEKEGFRKLEETGIELQIDQTARLVLALQVGAVEQTVEVHAEVPVLNTANAATGDVIVSREMSELPLDARDYTDLAFLVPGVTPSAQGSNSGNMNINGSRPDNTNYLIDGFSNQSPRSGGALAKPSLDAMQEFKMQTSSFSAEYGRLGGGVMNMALKTGTNQLHGSAFEFVRNDKFDARNFFDIGKSKLRRNQFGATLNGPIYIPKLYNGRDRTFFLVSWESYREISGNNRLGVIPTELEHNGNFSQTRDTKGKLISLLDPFANTPFAGNVIPASRWHSVATKLMPWYPMPNRPGQVNNYAVNANDTNDWNSLLVKVDHRVKEKGTISGRVIYRKSTSLNPFSGSDMGTFGNIATSSPFMAGLSYTHMFAPTVINETRATVNLGGNKDISLHQYHNWNKDLGITGATTNPNMVGFPKFNLVGAGGLGNMQLADNGSAPMNPGIHTYELADTLTWVKGNHLMKFGWSYFRFQFFMPTNGSLNGQFNFRANFTGNSIGDFILGLPGDTTRRLGDIKSYMFSSTYGAFVQDDYRLSSRLTLNIGLRYELMPPQYEKYGQYANFIPELGKLIIASDRTVPNLQQMVADNGLTGKVALAKDYGIPRSLAYGNEMDFAPRFGLAYRMSNKTVVRSGYGIYYAQSMTNTLRRDLSNVFPFTLSQTFNSVKTDPSVLTMSNPFPDALAKNGGTTDANGYNWKARPQYMQQWNLTLERELAKGVTVEMSYVGSKGTHLGFRYDLNQPFYDPALMLPGGSYPRPYSQYQGITYYDFAGDSSYHGGTVTARKRLSRGAFFRVSYTLAKSLDNSSQFADNTNGGIPGVQNSRNFSMDRGRSDWDRRHALAMSFVTDLPYRQMFLPEVVAKTLLRGWQLSGTGTMYSGQGFTPRVQNASLNQGDANRPDRIASGKLDNPGPDAWFDLSAFPVVPRGSYRFGNAGRNIVDGPGQINLNVAVVRNFRVKERGNVQFRWESFNATNHTNLRLPVNNLSLANAGTITGANNSRSMQFGLRFQF